MSDFEERVRSALNSASESAPPADGLAPAARGRLRKRRRTTFVAVAAALVVAAIPTGLAIANGGDRSDPAPPVATETPSGTPDEGWRWESYRDVELQVPDGWGYGGGTDWCIDTDLDSVVPQVTRPGGAVRTILCTPEYAFGVRFESSAAVDLAHPSGSVWQYGDEGVYPDGAWLSIVVEDEVAVTVVTRDRSTASRIVDSVQTFDGVDRNGCTPRVDEGDEDGDRGRADQDSRMPICRYGPDGRLVQSELLSEQDTESALEALSAAPVNQEPPLCTKPGEREDYVVMGDSHDLGAVVVRWESKCASRRGAFFSGAVRELTPEILYWALSPGWNGSVGNGVPLPDPLRS